MSEAVSHSGSVIPSVKLVGTSGVGGKKKTENGRAVALQHFNKYLVWRSLIPSESYDWQSKKAEFKDILCNTEVFQGFAGHLLQIKKANGDPYDEGTICQYLSGAKNVVHTLYPEHAVWKNHSRELSSVNREAWFTAINCGIQSEVATRKMNEEIEDQDVYVVGGSIIKDMITYLYNQERPHPVLAIERANEILTTVTTVGRANEASFASYKTS